ncbi:MAG TPA: hypothetical protein VNE41_07730 [Chitinophagaceae bacterium]|nr:hypothetical protein [Chitinophagaceae bacterium]
MIEKANIVIPAGRTIGVNHIFIDFYMSTFIIQQFPYLDIKWFWQMKTPVLSQHSGPEGFVNPDEPIFTG